MSIKILVGCPTSFHKEYALEEYSKSIKALTYPNHDLLLVDNSKDNVYLEKIKSLGIEVIKGPWFESARDRIIASRNILRQKVLDEEYDYFLSLEQDVLPPKDIIERLLQHNKQILSAVYFMPHSQGLIPMLAVNKGREKYSYLPFQIVENSNKIINVNYAGFGVLLISRKVLEEVKFRISDKPGFDDWWFCKDAESKGFKIYANLGIKCKHLLKNRPWDWSQLK